YWFGNGANVDLPKESVEGAFGLEPVPWIIGMLKILLDEELAVFGLTEKNTVVAGNGERLEPEVVAPAGAPQRCKDEGFAHTRKIARTSAQEAATVRPGLDLTTRVGSKRIRHKAGGKSGSARNSGRSSMK